MTEKCCSRRSVTDAHGPGSSESAKYRKCVDVHRGSDPAAEAPHPSADDSARPTPTIHRATGQTTLPTTAVCHRARPRLLSKRTLRIVEGLAKARGSPGPSSGTSAALCWGVGLSRQKD